jgi:hypothetical protein
MGGLCHYAFYVLVVRNEGYFPIAASLTFACHSRYGYGTNWFPRIPKER